MKGKMKTLLAAVIAAGIAITGMGYAMAASAGDSGANRITVNGEGRVAVTPDVAYLSVGVSTQHEEAKQAQVENNVIMSAIIEAVKKEGILETDIQTSGYSIYPNYDYSNDMKILGYSVSNNISVTVKDLDKIAAVLEAALDNGGNIASGIRFSILDSTEAYAEALALAVKDTQSKSVAIAKALGKKASSLPAEVIEGSGSYMPYERNDITAGAGARLMYDAAVESIQSGELNVTATITAVYSFD